jgi:hypothetical protein
MDMSLLPHRPIETLNILYNFTQNTSKKYFQKSDFQSGDTTWG